MQQNSVVLLAESNWSHVIGLERCCAIQLGISSYNLGILTRCLEFKEYIFTSFFTLPSNLIISFFVQVDYVSLEGVS